MAAGKRFLVLFNPSAGGGRALEQKEQLEALLDRHGISRELVVTDSEAHLRRAAGNGARAGRALAAAGGDSTFHIVVNEIMRHGPRAHLALIGLGSSNDIPLEFGVETLEKACLALKRGRPKKIDLGLIRQGSASPVYFLGQANIGLGAAVNRYVIGLVERRSRWAKHQTAAGVLGILNAYRTRKIPVSLQISTPSVRVGGPFVLAVFSNIRFWATGKKLCPTARPDDGQLDACLFKDCSFPRLVRLNHLIPRGKHTACRDVQILQSPSFDVVSDSPFLVQTDGEMLMHPSGSGPLSLSRVRFETVPSALNLIS